MSWTQNYIQNPLLYKGLVLFFSASPYQINSDSELTTMLIMLACDTCKTHFCL